MKKTILLLVVLAMVACNTKVETKTERTVTVDKDSIKTAIQNMENAYATALRDKNIEGIMTYYADDAMSIDNGKAPISGKENIRKAIEEQMKSTPANADISMTAQDVLVSDDGGMVSETGIYAVKDSSGTEVSSGYYAVVFQKKDGKYQCVRELVTASKKGDGNTEEK